MRKCIEIGPMHCYYLRDGKQVLSLVVQANSHGLEPGELANRLREAAAWFEEIAREDVT